MSWEAWAVVVWGWASIIHAALRHGMRMPHCYNVYVTVMAWMLLWGVLGSGGFFK